MLTVFELYNLDPMIYVIDKSMTNKWQITIMSSDSVITMILNYHAKERGLNNQLVDILPV